jgi:hypothetical protein
MTHCPPMGPCVISGYLCCLLPLVDLRAHAHEHEHAHSCPLSQRCCCGSRSTFPMTDTEISVIACAGDHWTEQQTNDRLQDTRGNGHAKDVVDKRKKEILADILHGASAQAVRADNPSEVALHQRDPGTLYASVIAVAAPYRDSSLAGQATGPHSRWSSI